MDEIEIELNRDQETTLRRAQEALVDSPMLRPRRRQVVAKDAIQDLQRILVKRDGCQPTTLCKEPVRWGFWCCCSFSTKFVGRIPRGGENICSLAHIEFYVKTLHLGTVSVCLAKSSPLPRYCCCVDCLYCDLEYLILNYIFSDTENWRSTELEIRGIPCHW